MTKFEVMEKIFADYNAVVDGAAVWKDIETRVTANGMIGVIYLGDDSFKDLEGDQLLVTFVIDIKQKREKGTLIWSTEITLLEVRIAKYEPELGQVLEFRI